MFVEDEVEDAAMFHEKSMGSPTLKSHQGEVAVDLVELIEK